MLYNYNQLQNLEIEDLQIPLSRYLYKFHNHRKEIKKLKTHEKDFLFSNMFILRDSSTNVKCFDLSIIDEASEYYFNLLILIYAENLNFDKPTKNQYGRIIESQVMATNKVYFDNRYNQWIKQLETKKGKYFNVIHTELNRKLKELDSTYKEVSKTDYDYQIRYLYALSFYIYYKVKLFFDGQKDKFVLLNVLGESIVINIYSFVHTLFRHYIPSLDIGNTERSINDQIPFLDIDNFPFSIKEFLTTYFDSNKSPLNSSREYLLFSFRGDKYVIWLKYSKLEDLNNDFGFEFRTLYKCKEKRDLDKFIGLSEHKINADLSFYF